MVRLPFSQLLKHQINRILKFLIILPHLHGVDKLNEGGEVLFLHRGLIVDVTDQGAVQKRFRFQPEIIPALALTFGVGNQGGDELQNVLLTVNVRERIIVKRLLEVNRVQYFDAVAVALQELPTFDYDAAFQNDLSRT